jgi:tRNA-(ms[2]io[6]A)-hydroxylase
VVDKPDKRRLPVLQSPKPSDAEDDGEPRPPWHWVGFGTVLIFAAWLPLAYVGGAVQARMLASKFGEGASKDQIDLAVAAMTAGERAQLALSQAIPGVLALALASFAGGIVVGRFGAGAGARESARAGGLTAAIATVLAFRGVSTATLVSALVTFAVAIGFAAWGGKVGARKKSPAAG